MEGASVQQTGPRMTKMVMSKHAAVSTVPLLTARRAPQVMFRRYSLSVPWTSRELTSRPARGAYSVSARENTREDVEGRQSVNTSTSLNQQHTPIMET